MIFKSITYCFFVLLVHLKPIWSSSFFFFFNWWAVGSLVQSLYPNSVNNFFSTLHHVTHKYLILPGGTACYWYLRETVVVLKKKKKKINQILTFGQLEWLLIQLKPVQQCYRHWDRLLEKAMHSCSCTPVMGLPKQPLVSSGECAINLN